MIKLGITGGIGSGKSTVSDIFKLLGIPVYIADIESRQLTATSPIIRAKLTDLFGEDLYEGNKLNKQLLASFIFNDKDKLAAVNAIIHPEVFKHFGEWVEQHHNESIVAAESAILYESGMDRFIDRVVMVYTPVEERISRVMKRDNISREKVQERIANQMSDEEKAKLADFVVYNDESRSLIQQCKAIIDKVI